MSRLKRIYLPNHCYFITTTAYGRQRLFVSDAVNEVLVGALDFCRGALLFQILGYVIMPDHMHILVLPEGEADITRIMHSFKNYTGRTIKKMLGLETPVWQHQFYDHVIRSDADLRARLEYMHGNPIRQGLVERIEAYRWCSWRNYFMDDHSAIMIYTGLVRPRREGVASDIQCRDEKDGS